jgi:hypothetical protein
MSSCAGNAFAFSIPAIGLPRKELAIVINITNVRWNLFENFIPLPPSFTDR